MRVLLLLFQFGFPLFLFLLWLLWPRLPKLCWIVVVRMGTLFLLVFMFQLVNMVYHIHWFVNIDESLHPRDKAHLVMMYDLFNMLLDPFARIGHDGWMASRLNVREFEWTPGVGNGQGGLACCNSWGRKESDTTEWLNWTELNWTGSVLKGYAFLRICAFLPSCPFYWHIVADSSLLWSLCIVSCDVSFFISNFIDLILLPFFLDEAG